METVSLYSEEGPLNKSREGQEPAVSGASCVLSPESRQVRKALVLAGRGGGVMRTPGWVQWLSAPQCTCGCWLWGSSPPGFRASVGACSSSTDSLP